MPGRVGEATSARPALGHPWPAERDTADAAALPDRYRAIVAAVAGFNRHVWKPALEGVNVRAVAEYLATTTPGSPCA